MVYARARAFKRFLACISPKGRLWKVPKEGDGCGFQPYNLIKDKRVNCACPPTMCSGLRGRVLCALIVSG